MTSPFRELEPPYRVIFADPPWHFKTYSDEGRDRSPSYETMKLPDLMKLPVADIADKNSVLIMWAYDPMLPEAIKLGEAWGFKFVTVAFRWMKAVGEEDMLSKCTKLNFGLGYYARGGGCEEALMFKRGRGVRRANAGVRKEFLAPLRKHSRKPDEAYEAIERLFGDVSRVDLFARRERPGWDVWGDEIGAVP